MSDTKTPVGDQETDNAHLAAKQKLLPEVPEVENSRPIGRNEWLTNVLMPLALGGVAGFFSAVIALQGQINDVSLRVNTLETQMPVLKTETDKVVDIQSDIESLSEAVQELQDAAKFDELLRTRVQSYIEETRERTATELRRILEDN